MGLSLFLAPCSVFRRFLSFLSHFLYGIHRFRTLCCVCVASLLHTAAIQQLLHESCYYLAGHTDPCIVALLYSGEAISMSARLII